VFRSGPADTIRQDVHDMVLKGLINTKESAIEPRLSSAAKKICSTAVNSNEWKKDGRSIVFIVYRIK
jgi:hypothetical protein